MKKRHDLKCEQPFFNAVLNGFKNFEIRNNDRDFQIGDIVVLHEFVDGELTGFETMGLKIRYVARNCEKYGLKKGYCVFGW